MYVTDTKADEGRIDEWYDLMPPGRRERAGRFRNEPDRQRCILAYALLVTAVREVDNDIHLNIASSARDSMVRGTLDISETAGGKPYLTDIPVCFNISHSKERVAVAVSPGSVGCDVECKNANPLKIAKRFFTDNEYAFLKGINSEEECLLEFTKLWTLKESVVKCLGEGIRRPFDDFSLVDDKGIRYRTIELSGFDRQLHIMEYESERGYCYSLCSVCADIEDKIRRVELK